MNLVLKPYWSVLFLALGTMVVFVGCKTMNSSRLKGKENENVPVKMYYAQNIVVSRDIKDSFPCVDSLLQDIFTCNKWKSYQLSVVKFFCDHNQDTLIFMAEDLPTHTGGESRGAFLNISNGRFKDTILLNRMYLKNASKEYLVSVITHETIHSFIEWCILSAFFHKNDATAGFLKKHFPYHWKRIVRAKTIDAITEEMQHDMMGDYYQEYIQQMVDSYTNPKSPRSVRDSIALALSWGGLYTTSAWKQLEIDKCSILSMDFWARNAMMAADTTFIYSNCDEVPKTYLKHLNLSPVCHN